MINPVFRPKNWQFGSDNMLCFSAINLVYRIFYLFGVLYEYRNKDKEVKKSMIRKWVNALHLAQSAEKGAGGGGKMKNLFEITKTLYNERSKSVNH